MLSVVAFAQDLGQVGPTKKCSVGTFQQFFVYVG